MGLPPSVVQQLNAAESQRFEVWPANMPIIDTWMVIATQWRTEALADGRVHWLGLDYASARAGLEMAGMAVTPGDWAGVRLMERTASAALNGLRG